MARLQQVYKEKVVPELLKEFAYKNVMQVPRVKKITLNMGVGEAVADKKQIENAVRDMTAIAGQKPVVTKHASRLRALRSVTVGRLAARSPCVVSTCGNSWIV